MDYSEKTVSYTTENSYITLNKLTPTTKNVWIVLHGIGYLSRYFIRYFDGLDPKDNYVVAPQAPSKYYLNANYKRVGASWLTKENTQQGINNVMNYLDAVLTDLNLPEHTRLFVFGYSQGVSVATRWVANRKLKLDRLILYSGKIPDELTANQFNFLEDNSTSITTLIGDNDEYLTQSQQITESNKTTNLFNGRAEQIVFKGGHELKRNLIENLAP